MPTKVRVNIANHLELLELPGIGRSQVEAIIRFRAEHGPITSESELSRVLGWRRLDPTIAERVDFEPIELKGETWARMRVRSAFMIERGDRAMPVIHLTMVTDAGDDKSDTAKSEAVAYRLSTTSNRLQRIAAR